MPSAQDHKRDPRSEDSTMAVKGAPDWKFACDVWLSSAWICMMAPWKTGYIIMTPKQLKTNLNALRTLSLCYFVCVLIEFMWPKTEICRSNIVLFINSNLRLSFEPKTSGNTSFVKEKSICFFLHGVLLSSTFFINYWRENAVAISECAKTEISSRPVRPHRCGGAL